MGSTNSFNARVMGFEDLTSHDQPKEGTWRHWHDYIGMHLTDELGTHRDHWAIALLNTSPELILYNVRVLREIACSFFYKMFITFVISKSIQCVRFCWLR